MMPHELVYTSTPRGLKPGSTGYCTVAQTPELPRDLADQLEAVSHYRHLKVNDPVGNPVVFSHSILTAGYFVHHVLSRIADSGLDHSGRSNFLAHHVSFDPDHLPDAGPAWLCEQRLFIQKWDRPADLIKGDRAIPSGRSEAKPCTKWQKLTGDAGWGGVLAGATNAAEPAYIVYEQGQDVLGLLVESMALLAPESRWNVTFSTYFTGKAVRSTCQWRCVIADSAEAREAISNRRGVVIRLDERMSGAPSGPLVEAARTGHTDHPETKRRVMSPPPPPVRKPRAFDVVEDLPEPIVPASRPIRTREPLPEDPSPADDSRYDIPAAPRASGRGVGPLLLGLLLGGLLILALTAIVELVGKKSFAGDFEKLDAERKATEADLAIARSDLALSKSSLNSAERDRDLVRREATTSAANHKTELDNATTAHGKTKEDLTKEQETNKKLIETSNALEAMLKDAKLFQPNGNDERVKLQQAERIRVLEGRLAAFSGRIVVAPVKLPEKLEAMFNLDLKIDPGAEVAFVGFSDPLIAGEAGGIKAPGGFAANPLNAQGVVQVGLTNPQDHPLFGLSLLRVKSGNAINYYQLFSRTVETTRLVSDAGMAAGGEHTWKIPFDRRLNPLVDRERRLGKLSLVGRNARLAFGTTIVDLDRINGEALENRPGEKDPRVRLTIEGDTIVVRATEMPAGQKCAIELLDIVRIIPPNPAVNFPGHEQELHRFIAPAKP